ncbi:hypothetical protein B0H13DRAFT_1853286 [Mycena leptocephala]|nr:hypothetical protein B0H13DRAFT_1853286 [Mycena leptocephala]
MTATKIMYAFTRQKRDIMCYYLHILSLLFQPTLGAGTRHSFSSTYIQYVHSPYDPPEKLIIYSKSLGHNRALVKDMADYILLACGHHSTGALQMNEPQPFMLPPTLKVGFDPEIELLHHMSNNNTNVDIGWTTQPTTNGIDIRQTIWHIVSHDDGLTAGKTTGLVVLPTLKDNRRQLARKRL